MSNTKTNLEMSTGNRVSMPRRILHRGTDKPHLEYEDGYREEFFDKEQIRWLLLENHSLVSFFKLFNFDKVI